MKNMYFSSGGFSAKYGDALSGVLAIETKNEPESPRYDLGISIANISLTGETLLTNNGLGIRFDLRQNFTKPIFWLNGGNDDIFLAPTSRNATGALIYRYSTTGRIKVDGIFADDKQGINVKRAEYDGVFNGETSNSFINLQNSDIFSAIILKTSLSYNKYGNSWKFGVLQIINRDNVYKLRSDMEYQLYPGSRLFSGIELEKRTSEYLGILPKNDYDIAPDAQSKNINSHFSVLRIGAYSEFEIVKPAGINKASLVAGARVDYMPYQKISWFDPRISFGYQLNDKSTVRAGFGIYHQIPDPRLFSESDGNPNLKSMYAVHYILSYDNNPNEVNSMRIELYHKQYKALPLKNEILNYDNNGYGYADGIDIIAKGELPWHITGWISYGFINTKRKWMDFEEFTQSTYDITHNLSLIVKYNFSPDWQIGINGKYATGKPYTPVIGSIFHTEENVYEPLYGNKNSSRYPNYKRLDLRLTHFTQIFGKFFTIFYLEGLNILGVKNLFDYTYNKRFLAISEEEQL
jgi:hypothetical protein